MPARQSRLRAGRLRRIATGSLAVALMAAAMSGCRGSSKGLGRLSISGVVQYAPANGKLHAASSGQMLRAGDQVQVKSGSAAIRLAPDGLLELRPGTAMTVNKVSRLTAGAVLIEPSGHPLAVSAANATLAVPSGAAQLMLDPGLDAGLTAKVYQDKANLQIPGNPALGIVAPRQADLTIHSLLPIPAHPLKYDDADAWDRRYLGTAEAFSRQLTAAATGFDAQLPVGQVHDAAFYRQLLPGLDHQNDYGKAFQVVQGLQSEAIVKPGDYLIALALALRGRRGGFEEGLRQELLFKSQGADWALISVDQGVTDLGAVLDDVLSAIHRASLPFSTPGSGQVAFGPPATMPPPTVSLRPGAPRTATTPVRVNQNPTAPRVTTTTTTTVAPLLALGHLPKTGTPLDPLLDPLVDPLIDLLNRILAGKP